MKKVKRLLCYLMMCAICCVLCSCNTSATVYNVQHTDGSTKEITHREFLNWQGEYGEEQFKKEILENVVVSGSGIVESISLYGTNCVWSGSNNYRIIEVYIFLNTGTGITVYVEVPEPGFGKYDSKVGNFTNINVGDKIEFKTIGDPVVWCSKSMCTGIKKDKGIFVSLGVKFELTDEDIYYTGFDALKYLLENQVESIKVIK